MSRKNSLDNLPLPPPPSPSAGKRNMKVITLAIICVVLAAGLVGVIAVYGPNSNLPTQITNKDNTISQLQQQVDNLKLQTNITMVMGQLAILEQNLTEENALVNSYSSIANMTASATPVSRQGGKSRR